MASGVHFLTEPLEAEYPASGESWEKGNKQVGAFHYLLGFIYELECSSIAHIILLFTPGFIEEPSGAVCLFSRMLTSALSEET